MYINILYFAEYAVAPLVGAWIETYTADGEDVVATVAPLVGAWIETVQKLNYKKIDLSHPSWVRGLKQGQKKKKQTKK